MYRTEANPPLLLLGVRAGRQDAGAGPAEDHDAPGSAAGTRGGALCHLQDREVALSLSPPRSPRGSGQQRQGFRVLQAVPWDPSSLQPPRSCSRCVFIPFLHNFLLFWGKKGVDPKLLSLTSSFSETGLPLSAPSQGRC